MATKTYTINGAGQRFKYSIPFDKTPDSRNDWPAKPDGTLELSNSSGRIGTFTNGSYNEEKGAIAHVMRYQFTTSADSASTITLASLKWTGSFNHVVEKGSNTDLSVPRCLITTNSWPEDKLDIWGYDTKYGKVNSGVITISGSTAITSGDVPIYDTDFNQSQLKPNTTYYIFVFDNYGYPQNWGQRLFRTENGSLVITTEVEMYGKIGQPKIKSPDKSYIKPGDSFAVTWDEAEGGLNNPVTGYTITISINNYSKTYTVDSTKNTVTVEVPTNASRGYPINITVQANPEQSGYGSNPVSLNNPPKVNQLPGKPKVEFSRSIVPSSGGEVVFTLSGEDLDGQEITFKQGTEEITNRYTATVQSTTTYSFYINDGIENGPSTEVTITVNTAPSFNVSCNAQGFAYTVNVTNWNKENIEYTYYLCYDNIKKKLGSGTHTTHKIANICSLGLPPGEEFYFTVEGSDGIEVVSKDCPDKTLFTPKLPIYESGAWNGEKYITDLDGYFDTYFRPSFGEIGNFNRIQVNIGNKSFVRNIQTGGYISLEGTDLAIFTRGISIQVTFVFGYNDNQRDSFFNQYSITKSFIRTKNTFPNLLSEASQLYSSSSIPTFSFTNFFDSTPKLYGFESTDIKIPSITKINGTTLTPSIQCEQNSGSNDLVICKIDGAKVYNSLSSLLGESEYTIPMTITLGNDLGGVITTTQNFQIHTAALMSCEKVGLMAEEEDIEGWNQLLEGMKISTYEIKCKSYSKGQIYMQVYITKDGKNWTEYGDRFWSKEIPSSITYDSPNIFTFVSKSLPTIGRISSDYVPQFKFVFGTKIEKPVYEVIYEPKKTAKALLPPTATIISGIYNGTKATIKFTYSTKPDKVELGEEDITLTYSTQENVGEIVYTPNFNNKDFIEIQLEVGSSATASIEGIEGASYTSTVYSSTPLYRLFNIQPTVSYRKNRLGINSNVDGNEDTNYILKISPAGTSNATLIALVKSEKNEVATIELKNGGLSGFIIDCGTWDT